MNERIKQLAIQAGFFYEDYKDIWYLEYHNQTCEEEVKKFAELLIRECVEIVLDSSVEYATRPQIAEELKQHFGVKE